MEYSNINIDTNKKWAHAKSAVSEVEKKHRLAELAYMRELFNDRLPLGEELTEIQSYFDAVEQVIADNGDINHEEFEPERHVIDPETGGSIPYRYYSATLSKQRALAVGGPDDEHSDEGVPKSEPSEQAMGTTTPPRPHDDVSGESKEFPDLSHVAKRKRRSTSHDSKLGQPREFCSDHNPESELGCCRTV